MCQLQWSIITATALILCEWQWELSSRRCRLKLASSPVHAPVVIVASLHAQPVWNGTLHSHSVHPVHAHAFAWWEDSDVDEIPNAKPKISVTISVIRNVWISESQGCMSVNDGSHTSGCEEFAWWWKCWSIKLI